MPDSTIALEPPPIDDLDDFHLEKRTPLWFYVLREAQVTNDGDTSARFTTVDLLEATGVVVAL
jgi:hypothetical protein